MVFAPSASPVDRFITAPGQKLLCPGFSTGRCTLWYEDSLPKSQKNFSLAKAFLRPPFPFKVDLFPLSVSNLDAVWGAATP